MPPKSPIGSPAEWLARAESSLALARMEGPGILFEDLCYQSQQAVEKALKAVLLAKTQQCPFTHDLDALMEKLEEAGVEIPEAIDAAGVLTRYAVETRYPHLQGAVARSHFEEAIRLAEGVLDWARGQI